MRTVDYDKVLEDFLVSHLASYFGNRWMRRAQVSFPHNLMKLPRMPFITVQQPNNDVVSAAAVLASRKAVDKHIERSVSLTRLPNHEFRSN